MSDWRSDIENAPKDGSTVLVYGQPDDVDDLRFERAGIHTAYWDAIDEAFCLTGATWQGPFIAPTRWQDCPEPPQTDTA